MKPERVPWRHLIPLSVLIACPLHAQYVTVTSEIAAVRAAASPTAQLVVYAHRDDLFKEYDKDSSWYRIVMFSGAIRYVRRSDAQERAAAPALGRDTTIRARVFQAIVEAQRSAAKEAAQRYPNDDRQIDWRWLLSDRYELPYFRLFHVPPARYEELRDSICGSEDLFTQMFEWRWCAEEYVRTAAQQLRRYEKAARAEVADTVLFDSAQTAWKDYMHLACQVVSRAYWGGSLRGLYVNHCYMRLAYQRAYELWQDLLSTGDALPKPQPPGPKGREW